MLNASTDWLDEKHCAVVFETLDRLESMLAQARYLVGNVMTEADVRLFTTIVRFGTHCRLIDQLINADPVYHGHFKCNVRTIEHGYPNILRWLRRVYQTHKVNGTVNMDHIKKLYYTSQIKINPTQIVPLNNGPDLNIPIDQ